MAGPSRKRRAPVDDEERSETPRNRRRASTQDEEVDFDELEEEQNRGSGSVPQLAKSLVRYALACEYARVPIKRQDVSQKVLGSHSRSFKPVFDTANSQLLDTFGMEFVELPNKEKTTMRQKRAAQVQESQTKSSGQWVLRNALPDRFRTPEIMGPSQIPNEENESTYIGLYTFAISVITMSGGVLSEGKLDRFLKRMNTDENTPIGTTDELMKRMIKDGYIVKVKDTSSGEEVTDYYVGPRGKVEVGNDAVKGYVNEVFSIGDPVEDLEQRLERSLGASIQGANAEEAAAPTQKQQRPPGRPRRHRDDEEEEDEE